MSKKVHYRFLILILVACVLTAVSLFITSGIYLLNHDPKAIDFLAFYTGAALLLHEPSSLYNLHTQLVTQQQIAPITQSVPLFLPFLNPPFAALVFSPFIFLGLQVSYALWIGINIVILLVICLFALRELKGSRWYIKTVVILGIITFIPLLTSILLGQLSLILCLIFLVSWLLLKQKKELFGGLVLSLLLIKPHLILLPLLFVLLQGRRHMIFGFLMGIFILTILSFYLVGASGINSYIALLNSATSWNTGYGIDVMAQHSLQTVLLILFNTSNLGDIRTIWTILFLLLVVPIVFLWSRKSSFSSVSLSLQFSLLIVVVLVTSPHTHFHDLSLLTIVTIMLVSVFSKMKSAQKKRYLVLLPLGYLIMLGGYLLDLWAQTHFRQIWIVGSVGYLLVLFGSLLYDLFHLHNDRV